MGQGRHTLRSINDPVYPIDKRRNDCNAFPMVCRGCAKKYISHSTQSVCRVKM